MPQNDDFLPPPVPGQLLPGQVSLENIKDMLEVEEADIRNREIESEYERRRTIQHFTPEIFEQLKSLDMEPEYYARHLTSSIGGRAAVTPEDYAEAGYPTPQHLYDDVQRDLAEEAERLRAINLFSDQYTIEELHNKELRDRLLEEYDRRDWNFQSGIDPESGQPMESFFSNEEPPAGMFDDGHSERTPTGDPDFDNHHAEVAAMSSQEASRRQESVGQDSHAPNDQLDVHQEPDVNENVSSPIADPQEEVHAEATQSSQTVNSTETPAESGNNREDQSSSRASTSPQDAPRQAPPRSAPRQRAPFEDFYVDDLSERVSPPDDAEVISKPSSDSDLSSSYLMHVNMIRQQSRNQTDTRNASIVRLYANRLNLAEKIYESGNFARTMSQGDKTFLQIPNDVRARRIMQNVQFNGDSSQKVESELCSLMNIPEADRPASNDLIRRLDFSMEGFRKVSEGETRPTQRLAWAMGSVLHTSGLLMESPDQLFKLSVDESPIRKDLLDTAFMLRYGKEISQLETNPEDMKRAARYLDLCKNDKDSKGFVNRENAKERQDLYLKMEGNPRSVLALANLCTDSKDRQKVQSLLDEDSLSLIDFHINKNHYAESGMTPKDAYRGVIQNSINEFNKDNDPESIKGSVALYVYCVENASKASDSSHRKAWEHESFEQYKNLSQIFESHGANDLDAFGRILDLSQERSLNPAYVSNTFERAIDSKERFSRLDYDPETGLVIDNRDPLYDQKVDSLFKNRAVGPQFKTHDLKIDEDVDVVRIGDKPQVSSDAPQQTDANGEPKKTQAEIDKDFWQSVYDNSTETGANSSLKFKEGCLVNKESGFSADRLTRPFVALNSRSVKQMLKDESTPAFGLPLDLYGEKSVGVVSAGLKDLMSTSEGRIRIRDLMEGTKNLRDGILASDTLKGLTEVDLLRHDQLEMGYRALVSAVGGGGSKARYPEFEGMDAYFSPFQSSKAAATKMNDRYVHAVRMTPEEGLKIRPPSKLEQFVQKVGNVAFAAAIAHHSR